MYSLSLFDIISIFDRAPDHSPRLFCVDPPIVDLATKFSEATSAKDGLIVKVGKRYAEDDNNDEDDNTDEDDYDEDDDDYDAFLKIVHGNLRLIYDPRQNKSNGKLDFDPSNGELPSFAPFLREEATQSVIHRIPAIRHALTRKIPL